MQKQPSPENYIRTRARQLPIHKCYINESWKDGGLATIIVARKHTNGNFTIGTYLVDLFCFGLKDSFYYFNIAAFELDDIKKSLEEDELIIETDYPLIHNIIYGAIEFADDYEFKPHKSFNLTQYILEEDTDAIELIEIDFGIDDKPAIVAPRSEFPTKIVAHLERVAGAGNYSIIDVDDGSEWTPDDSDIEDEMYDSGELLDDYSNYTLEELIEEFEMVKEEENIVPALGLIFEIYIRIIEEGGNMFEPLLESIQEGEVKFDITADYTDPELNIVPGNKALFYDLQDIVFGNKPGAIDKCLNAIKESAHPSYYSLLLKAYQNNNQFDKADEISKKAFELYPDNLLTRINYAFYLFCNNQLDKLELFMMGFDISKIVTDRETIHLTEIAGVYHLACIYYLAKEQHLKAAVFQKLYDMLDGLTDHLYEMKLELFEMLAMQQLEEIQKRAETFASK